MDIIYTIKVIERYYRSKASDKLIFFKKKSDNKPLKKITKKLVI